MKVTTNKPIAVLISDIHYNIQTLEVADKALRLAVDKANQLEVPLIVAGDLHDTKANIRGECIAAMLKTFTELNVNCYILRGNHDQINEKSEEHSLEFLRYVAGVLIIDKPIIQPIAYFIPYQSDPDKFREILKNVPKDKLIIAHQGVEDTETGHYFMDHSAVKPSDLAGRRIISGHYHTRQTIELPKGGRFDYIGNPYTLTYAEAKDPVKGFQVLYTDGSLEVVPTNLRKHVIIDLKLQNVASIRLEGETPEHSEIDLIKVTVHGPSDKLSKLKKSTVADYCQITQSFRLDQMPVDTKVLKSGIKESMPQNEILDGLIDSLSNTDKGRKERLKALWKQFTGDK